MIGHLDERIEQVGIGEEQVGELALRLVAGVVDIPGGLERPQIHLVQSSDNLPHVLVQERFVNAGDLPAFWY